VPFVADATSHLDDLVTDSFLRVPDYQRAYAWGLAQLSDFWEDLELIERGRTHYTGTVVLKRHAETEFDEALHTSVDVFDVVDGQQRLTTCLMLVDRLLDHRERLDDPRAASDREALLTIKLNGVIRPRLALSDENDDYWRKVIIDGVTPVQAPVIKAHSRLSTAAEFFEERIRIAEAEQGEAFLDWLRDMTGRVTKSLEFTVYRVRDEAEVGVIFETLNQRGKPLSELEKVKNYLLYLASRLPDGPRTELSAIVNTKFAEIFKHLGSGGLSSSHEDQMLRAHWLATEDPDARNWSGADSIKSRFHRRKYLDEPQLAFDDVAGYAESLADGAFIYSEILLPKVDGFAAFGAAAKAARDAADRLRQSGNVAIFVPLLMAARLARTAAGAEYVALSDICERYSIRVFMIAERRSNAGRSRLYSLAFDITRAKRAGASPAAMSALISETVLHVAGLAQYYATDDDVLAALLDASRNWYAKPGHKYFLFQYELFRLGKKSPSFTFDQFVGAKRSQTTEHILPQNPGPSGWSQFSQQARARHTHSLGNLVLTFDNSVYSNHSFRRKRDGDTAHPDRACYRTSTLLQERDLADVEEWNVTAIMDRQKKLAEWAVTRWALPEPVTGDLPEVDEADVLADATDVEESALESIE
jgi:hypothetical protein